MDGYKICSICALLKEETSEFYSSKFGYENQCKVCRNAAKYKSRIEKRKKLGLSVRAIGNTQSRILKEQGLHYCPRCELVKPITDFSTIKVKGGIASHCKSCCNELGEERSIRDDVKQQRHDYYESRKRKARDRALRKKFGITIDDYESLLALQNNVCAICGKIDKSKSLAVDHDHNTGQVRSLLCSRCNPAVGFLLEDFDLIEKVLEYVKKWKA